MAKRFSTHLPEGQVQLMVNLVCDKLDLGHVRIDPMNREDEVIDNADGVYYEMLNGFPTIQVINQGHVQLVLHELAHHYQYNKTDYEGSSIFGGGDTPHGPSFTKGINAVTRAMVKIFGKERWPCTPAYLRSNSIKNVKREN